MFCAQCYRNEKWRNWRPHLTVMFSNETGNPALQQKAIITMGDSLGIYTLTDRLWVENMQSDVLCSSLGSLQRAYTCCSFVLRDSKCSLWSVYTEGRETGASRQHSGELCFQLTASLQSNSCQACHILTSAVNFYSNTCNTHPCNLLHMQHSTYLSLIVFSSILLLVSFCFELRFFIFCSFH